MKEGPLLELISQRYVTPYRNRRVIFRFSYYCDQAKSRKANYIEIIGSPKEEEDEENIPSWDYRDTDLIPLYKSYNGLQEFEKTARKITHLINIVF